MKPDFMKYLFTSALIAVGGMLASCDEGSNTGEEVQSEPERTENTLTAEERAEGWRLLFDGQSTQGWRGYNQETMPDSWVVEEGTLKSMGQGGDIGGDIVYDVQPYANFELTLNWKIEEGGNSGIFYHIVEGEEYDAPYYTAPEFQLIDQEGFPEKLEPWQSLGGDYGMYDPDYEGAMKPAGEWNTARIVFTEENVEYYLNGKKTLEFEPWSEDWKKRKEEGKWQDYPDYGEARSGLIGLQDHGSFIWFKNIKIREL